MDIIVKNNISHKYEGFTGISRKFKQQLKYGKTLSPIIPLIEQIEKHLIPKNIDVQFHCIYCGDIIKLSYYSLYTVHWPNIYVHYLKKHNVIPSKEFVHFIKSIKIVDNNLMLAKDTNGEIILKGNKINNKYVKLSRNQLMILDSLYESGGNKQYNYNGYNMYSEHSGLLELDNNKLIKIIVNAKENHYDKSEVLMPSGFDIPNNVDYIFHTHPQLSKPANRTYNGILYEFPSISDIFFFIYHLNITNITGSIVIAPEGLYIITSNYKRIMLHNSSYIFKKYTSIVLNIQRMALDKYSLSPSLSTFYNKIINDYTYINLFNSYLKNIGIKIKYYKRIYSDNNNKWILPSIKLKMK